MSVRWRLAVTAAVVLLVGTAFVVATTGRGEVATPPPVRDPLACSARDRESIVDAMTAGYSRDVADGVVGLRCLAPFAYGTVCVLCATPPAGAFFGVLLQRERDGTWRYIGSGGPDLIERLAARAGLSRSDLDRLRRARR